MMRAMKKLMYSVLLVVATATLLLILPRTAQASNTIVESCISDATPYYDAIIETPADSYDLYVKVGKRGQSSTVQLFLKDGAATCQSFPAVMANGDRWQKVGTWTNQSKTPILFQLASADFARSPDANRPTVMMVPTNNPPCTVDVACRTSLDDKTASIAPSGNLLSEDTLHVTLVIDPKKDNLIRVDYYVDNDFLYSSPQLEDINMGLIPGGKHTVSRVMQYSSGQQLVLEEQVDVSFVQDFQNFIYRTINSNRTWLQLVAIVGFIGFIGSIVLLVSHVLHRRRVWKLTHGLTPLSLQNAIDYKNMPANYVPAAHILDDATTKRQKVKKYSLIICLALSSLLLFVLVDSFVFTLFRVDGESMQNTLKNGQLVVVDKLPKTLGTVSGQQFIPNRGDIVVFEKSRSDNFKLVNPEESERIFVIKRVIGLPGERVVIKDGQITIYNKTSPSGFNPDTNASWQATMVADTSENIDVTLGPDELFVSGDNRPASTDSRINGPINVQQLVGKVGL